MNKLNGILSTLQKLLSIAFIAVLTHLCGLSILIAQNDIYSNKISSEVNTLLNDYDSEYPNGRATIDSILQVWADQGLKGRKAKLELLKTASVKGVVNLKNQSCKEYSDRSLWIKGIKTTLTHDEITFLQNSFHIINLFYLGLLKPEEGWTVQIKDTLVNNLISYGIQPNMRILDVGAGRGYLALHMSMAVDSLDYTLNEINQYLSISSQYLMNIIKKRGGLQDDDFYYTVGSKRSTKAAGFYDRIILRNTLHHFDDNKRMLASIKQSMLKKSILIVRERVKDESQEKPKDCKDRISCKEIEKRMKKAKFTLISKQQLGNREYIYHYKK